MDDEAIAPSVDPPLGQEDARMQDTASEPLQQHEQLEPANAVEDDTDIEDDVAGIATTLTDASIEEHPNPLSTTHLRAAAGTLQQCMFNAVQSIQADENNTKSVLSVAHGTLPTPAGSVFVQARMHGFAVATGLARQTEDAAFTNAANLLKART